MSTTYTFKFNLTPKHMDSNFLNIKNEVVWDAMPEGCAYTTHTNFETGVMTYELSRGELSAQAQADLQAKIQELVVEFA